MTKKCLYLFSTGAICRGFFGGVLGIKPMALCMLCKCFVPLSYTPSLSSIFGPWLVESVDVVPIDREQ